MFSTTIHQIWLEGADHLREHQPVLHQNVVKMRQLHNDNVRLWTSDMIESLIEIDYPHLKATYDGYQHAAFKVQFAKYVILHKCGGFVVDIDCKPKKCLYQLMRAKHLHRHFLPLVVNDTDPYKCRSSKKFLNTFCLYMPYPEHPLMNIVLAEAPKAAKRRPLECQLAHLLRSVGAYFLTACVKKYKKQTQRELKKPAHKDMIHDMVRSYSDIHAREPSLSRSLSWSSLSDSLSRSELKGKVHTQDVVNLESVSTIDFYLYHDEQNRWLGENWESSLKTRQRAKLGGAQIAVVAVCIGVLVAVL